MATLLRAPVLERWTQWWQLRTPPERATWAAVAALFAVLAAWLVIVQPAARDSERLAKQVTAQRVALAQAQRRSDEIAGLSRNDAPPPLPRDVRSMLDAALARHNLRATIDRIDDQRIRLTVDSVEFGVLTSLIDDLQRTRIRPVELNATARVEPAQVRAELTITSD